MKSQNEYIHFQVPAFTWNNRLGEIKRIDFIICYQQDRNSRKAHSSNNVVKERAYSNSLSALPRRRGLKQHWRTELKSSVWEQQWHPRMLGNAIQVLERSIVRITLVRGKRKLGCTITNCFQILSFSQSKLLPKLSADTDTILAESYFSLWSVERVGTLLNLKHGPFFSSSHPLPICCIHEISTPLRIYCTWS